MKLPEATSDMLTDNPEENSTNGHRSNGSSNATNGTSNGNHGNRGSDRDSRHEDAMFGAIDAFCSTSEQTYEEFVEGFMYFKPGTSQNKYM